MAGVGSKRKFKKSDIPNIKTMIEHGMDAEVVAGVYDASYDGLTAFLRRNKIAAEEVKSWRATSCKPAEVSLYKKAIGFFTTTDVVETRDSTGAITETKETTKEHPPCSKSLQYLLNNKCAGEWSHTQNINMRDKTRDMTDDELKSNIKRLIAKMSEDD
jgi:hypothetical protein